MFLCLNTCVCCGQIQIFKYAQRITLHVSLTDPTGGGFCITSWLNFEQKNISAATGD